MTKLNVNFSKELTINVKIDDITRNITSMFDYEFKGQSRFLVPTIPTIESNFGIGLIVGPSGSGKSTLLKQFGKIKLFDWDCEKAIVSHFKSADEAAERFAAVGLNSIPTWMRPFHILSNGEQFRADLARRLNSNAVVDEFTSVIDRNVAKACSVAIRRYVDKHKLTNIVLASCHYDIIEWLQPDWVFNTSTGKIAGRGAVQRPIIELEILPCSSEIWPMFRQHHYLDGNINKSSRCWIAIWNKNPVGFASVLRFPNGNFSNGWREHRTVILPDYQGLGFGVRLSDAIGEMFLNNKCRFFSKTAHPRFGQYRNQSSKWRGTSKNGKARKDYVSSFVTKEDGHKHKHVERVCFSHEYIGDTT